MPGEKKGIIVVSAAGNEFRDIDTVGAAGFYPASYSMSNIITVGALDSNMRRVASSNWGKEVLIFLPQEKRLSLLFQTTNLQKCPGQVRLRLSLPGQFLIMEKKSKNKSKWNKKYFV